VTAEPIALHPAEPPQASGSTLLYRTLADIPDDPPGPLLFGMLEDGPTIAYGAPGVGKGTTGAWIVTECQAAGLRPVIYDAERRPREWSRRVAGLGGDRSNVVYVEPMDLPVSHRGRPLWDVAAVLDTIVTAAGGDLLMIDSIMPATGVGEERLKSDASVPFLWVAALDALGIPSLSFGHPPKGQPEGEPFGSFAWVAAARLTWLGTKAEGDGHRIRWRPKKRNERGHIPGVLLTIDYGDDGRPCSVSRADDEESTRDWLLAALVHGPRSVADMAEDMLSETDNPATGEVDRIKERLSRALGRMRHEGWVDRVGTSGPKVRWELRVGS
jgi:AAA domain-containing protein